MRFTLDAQGDGVAAEMVRGLQVDRPGQDGRSDAAEDLDYDSIVDVVPLNLLEVVRCLMNTSVDPILSMAGPVVVRQSAIEINVQPLSENLCEWLGCSLPT